MHLLGCGNSDRARIADRNRMTVLAVVALTLVFGVSALLPNLAGAGSHGVGIGRAASPANPGTPPTIYSFSASPNTFFQGSSTTLSVGAYSSTFNPLAYLYTGLPAGCASVNASLVTCTPTVGGSFNVTVHVTDTGTNGVALAYTSIYVNPVVNETFFLTQQQFASPEWVNVTESGLPLGTLWTAGVGNDQQTASTGTLSFLEMPGTYTYTVGPVPGYSPSVSSGTVTVTNFPASVFVSFSSTPVTFTETGLTAGATWAVTLNGEMASAVAPSSIGFSIGAGSYTYTVGYLTGYTASPRTGSVSMFGPTSVAIAFSAAAGFSAYNVTFSESTLVAGTFWSVDLNGTAFGSNSATITVPEPNGTYNYSAVPPVGFSASPASGQVIVAGVAPATVAIAFAAATSYVVGIDESGLPTGTSWSAAVDGISHAGTGAALSFTVYNGSHDFSVGGSAIGSVAGFEVVPQNGAFITSGAGTTIGVAYSPVSFLNQRDTTCTSINSKPFYQNFCYPEAQAPTLLTLANGNIGLGSQLYTNATGNVCPGAAAATNARVGFSLSSNAGVNFGPALALGNNTCQFLNAIEPSFATNGSSVYAAFVEENSTAFAPNYVLRASDALGFIRSTNAGISFSAATTLDLSGNIARPSVAAFGAAVYVVYEDIANSSAPLPGGALPISLKFVSSADGGLTWSVPTTLPGLNAAEQFTAMSPSIAVNASGAVAVAYATNRSCVVPNGVGGCNAFGDSIAVVTSLTNGATWQGPTVLVRTAGETLCYTGGCYPGFFESTPQIAAAYSPSGQALYVAYGATYNQGPTVGASNYNHSGIFAVEDSAGTVSGGPLVSTTGPTAVRAFNPGVGVSSKGVYLTYVEANESSGSSSFANSLTQWVTHAPLGAPAAWTPPLAISIDSFVSGGSVNGTRGSFPGFASSVGFDATGTPIVAFATPGLPATTIQRSPSFYYVNTTYPTEMSTGTLAVPGGPNTASITFTESGLPTGRTWVFSINGVSYPLTTPSIQVTNIPTGIPVLVGATYVPQFWEVVSTQYAPAFTTFYFSSSDVFSFQLWEGLEFNTIPSGLLPWLQTICCGFDLVEAEMLSSPFGAYAFGEWYQDTQFRFPPPYNVYSSLFYDGFAYAGGFSKFWSSSCLNYACPYQTPWYFPLGSQVEINMPEFAYGQLAPVYFSGTGAGSYTGSLSSSYCYGYYFCDLYSGVITMDGPINETLWYGNAPVNLYANVTFSATGLPASSQYSATLDSTPLVGNATIPAVAYNVPPGAHTVSDIWATSTQAGWEYFGSVVGPNPFVSPLVSGVSLLFTALVNLSAPAGQVTFHAGNLTPGTLWSIVFNQTTYSSNTPWINLTSRPGTFAMTVDDAVSPSGTAGFVPASRAGNISVLPGNTYEVSYVPAYQVELVATSGGFVSANGGPSQGSVTIWEAAGNVVQLHALSTTGYTFAGWSGSGSGAYSGNQTSPSVTVTGPIVETAAFLPLPGARFNLTIVATGLPAGAWWTVELNKAGYSSNAPSINVGNLWPWSDSPAGRYALSVPIVYLNSTDLTRFVPPPALPAYVGTNGTATPPLVIPYATQYYLDLASAGGGSVEATVQNQPLGTAAWLGQSVSGTITALPNPGYTFTAWQGEGAGSYSGPNAVAPIQMNAPVSEVAVFAPVVVPPPPTYSLTVVLDTPVAAGTTWSLTFGGVGYTASGSSFTISGLSAGNYGVLVGTVTSPDGLIQYRPTPTDPVAYTVSKTDTLHVALTPYYWVAVSTTAGGTVSPGSGYYAANQILYLVATPAPGYAFTQWSVQGTGGYTGSNATASIIVTGPLTEVAGFHSMNGGSLATSIWSNPETWAGVAAVGLVAGLGVGIVVARFVWRERLRGGKP